MSQPNNPSSGFEWKDLVFFLLGTAAQIIVGGIFADAFYLAVGIVVFSFAIFVLVRPGLTLKKWLNIGGALIVAVFIMGYHATVSIKPTFEINFIGLPYKADQSYYVTNNMIGRSDLNNFADFTLEPLGIEIVPHYSGNDKFGNVLLRISGAGGEKHINLWSDFDKDGQSQTISITFSEIIQLSGIKVSGKEISTNLMLPEMPYQSAKLNFEIIRLSDLDRSFAIKELEIKNMPWIQRAEFNYNNNSIAVDYSLNNLGADAKFHCILNVAKVSKDVDADTHSFWSGTEVVHYGPNCEPFNLKTGETYKTSLLLDKETMGQDLTRGRYVVQIYTFAERDDVKFNNNLTYETSSGIWLFADPGNLLTFVVCNDPGKNCADSVTLPIEEEIIRAYSYSSEDEWDNGVTSFVVKTYPVTNHSINHYVLDYWIDPQKTGWVGFGIWFENLADISAFNRIRFKLLLDQSLHPIYLDVKGKVGDTYNTARVEIGNGTYGEPKFEEQTITIPFNTFEGIDWAKVDTLYFGMDSFMVPNAEKHEIQISEIEFIR